MNKIIGIAVLLLMGASPALAGKHKVADYNLTGKVLSVVFPDEGNHATVSDDHGNVVTCEGSSDNTYCHDGVFIHSSPTINVELEGVVGTMENDSVSHALAHDGYGGVLADTTTFPKEFRYRIEKHWPFTYYLVLKIRKNSDGSEDVGEELYSFQKAGKLKKVKGAWEAK